MEEIIQRSEKDISPDELLDQIKKEFEHTSGVSFEMLPDKDDSFALTIKFDSTLDYDKKTELLTSIYSNINLLLKKHNIVITRVIASGNHLEKIRLDRKIIEGKLNWRRFLSSPEKFDEESIKILDEMADFDPLQTAVEEMSGDSYAKFNKFVSKAFTLGLINEAEKRKIENQLHLVG